MSADDWPQWRGPQRNGVWTETGVVERLDEPRLKNRWRVPIGSGYSGPTAAGRRVYVTDRLGKKERVHCFDAFTGNKIWSHSYPCSYARVTYPAGPRASVTIDDNRAYSLGAMGYLFCFNAVAGNILWQKDLRIEYDFKLPTWGIAASPLIEKNLLIVQIGGKDNATLVAFDKITGKEIWRALEDPINYSCPIVIDQAGKRVLISWTQKSLSGLDPQSGTLYWQQPYATRNGIASPVVANQHLFVSSYFDGSMLLKLDSDQLKVSVVWQRKGRSDRITDSLHCCISTPLLLGDYIYGVDSYGQLRCLELKTGNRIWENLRAVPKARWANIHMVRNADKVWMFNERGELIIGSLSPKGFCEISRAKLIDPTLKQLNQRDGVCWAHPAFAYRHIYLRNDKELICVDLTAND